MIADSTPGAPADPGVPAVATPTVGVGTVNSQRPNWLRWLLTIGLATLALTSIFYDTLVSGAGWPYLYQRFQTFVTIFLGIFIEAVPFLLVGSIVSGLIAVFVDQSLLDRYLPKAALPGALAGGLLGLLFPVCECGVVPVVRRLYEKGLPVSIGVTFLLAAPVVNPVVILSTYSAFGWGPILWGRVLFSFLIAVVVGYLFSRAQPEEVLLPAVNASYRDACCAVPAPATAKEPLGQRFTQSFNFAGDDFLDMVRYLIVGCLLAASMQTLIPIRACGRGARPCALRAGYARFGLLAFYLFNCGCVPGPGFHEHLHHRLDFELPRLWPHGGYQEFPHVLWGLQPARVLYLIVLPLLLSMLMGIWWNLNVG